MRCTHSKLLFFAVFGLSATACATHASDDSWVKLGDKQFKVEIADDDAERARGLMFRDALAADHGMLFVHEYEEPQAYWMKNTFFLICAGLMITIGAEAQTKKKAVTPAKVTVPESVDESFKSSFTV